MGYLKSFATSFVWICTIFAAITFIPGLPPNVDFDSYNFKSPAAINKEPNGKLNGAEKLFEGEFKGPEAFDSYDGVLYTTTQGGAVRKLVGNKLLEVVNFGKKCDGFWEEDKCGRPLGLKFDKQGRLYVVDTYYGIFRVDVKTGKYERIIDTAIPIEGKVAMTPNSIDVADNGDLFWTVSSTDFKLVDGLLSILSDPSGRLIHYNAATKTNKVLLEKLGFANGVKLSDDQSFVIVAETMTSRIIKYYLKGPQAGKSEVFIEALPGIPDNIHSDGKGNFIVSLFTVVDKQHPLLSQSLAVHSNIRKMIVRTITLLEAPFRFFDQVYPNYYAKKIVHWLGNFESVSGLSSTNFMVLRIDPTGRILDALDITDEKVDSMSSAFPCGDYLYLGSPWNPYLARVPLDKTFPDLKKTINIEPPVIKQVPAPIVEEQPVKKPVAAPTTTERPSTTPPPPPTTTTTPPPPTTTTPKPVPTTPPPVQAPKVKIQPAQVPVAPKPVEIPTVPKPVEKPVVVQRVETPQAQKQIPRDEM